VALRLPGLLPGPRGVGALGVLLDFAIAGRAAVRLARQDRLLSDYLRRKELDLEFQAVTARVPHDPAPPTRAQVVRSERESDGGGTPA
jgi:hypothetical protein